MTDLGLINCLKGIRLLSIHKKVFHKSTITPFSTKIHIFFSRNKKKSSHRFNRFNKKINEFYWGDRSALGLLWVRLGPLGSALGLLWVCYGSALGLLWV